MRYVYLGDFFTDPALKGRRCEPVRRDDGRCIVGQARASQLVIFEGERYPRVVMRRRLRVRRMRRFLIVCKDHYNGSSGSTRRVEARNAADAMRVLRDAFPHARAWALQLLEISPKAELSSGFQWADNYHREWIELYETRSGKRER